MDKMGGGEIYRAGEGGEESKGIFRTGGREGVDKNLYVGSGRRRKEE